MTSTTELRPTAVDLSGAIAVTAFRGWVHLGPSTDHKRGSVKTMRRFGKDIVVYRTSAGVLRAVDPVCPHLGAHLGDGDVVGECVRCPFHHWQFDGDGEVADVPMAKHLPRRARINTHHVVERGGVAFIYHYADGDDRSVVPSSFHPQIEKLLDATQGRLRCFGRTCIPATISETAENAADSAHFPIIHGRTFRSIEPMTHRVEDNAFVIDSTTYIKFRNMQCDLQLTFFDAFNSQTVNSNRFSRDAYLFAMVAPTEERELDILLMSDSKKQIPIFDRALNRYFSRAAEQAAADDLPIWRRKTTLDRPILSDADGPIMPFRRWHAQFRSPLPASNSQDLMQPGSQGRSASDGSSVAPAV